MDKVKKYEFNHKGWTARITIEKEEQLRGNGSLELAYGFFNGYTNPQGRGSGSEQALETAGQSLSPACLPSIYLATKAAEESAREKIDQLDPKYRNLMKNGEYATADAIK